MPSPIIFILIVGLLELVVMIGHLAVYFYLINIFSINNPHAELMSAIVILILSLSFISSLSVTWRFNNLFSRAFYKIAAVWMGFFVYLIFSSAVWAIFGKEVGIIFFILSLLITIYGILNSNYLQVSKLKIVLPGLEKYWHGKTIVFFADTHLGQIRNKRFLQKVINRINGFRPAIILHGGDFYDGVKTDIESLANLLSQKAESSHGVYFVTGNHESFDDSRIYTEPLHKAGVHVLKDEVIKIEGLQIAGVNYSSTEKEKEYMKVIGRLNIDKSTPSILIKHTPLHLEVPEKYGVDLVLSGHSHHGQIWPFRYITRAVFKGFDYGLKKLGDMNVYTTSGAGTWGPPLRVFTKSEIVVIELRNEH